MPMYPARPCSIHGCPNLALPYGGRCQDHPWRKRKPRGNTTKRGYGHAWRQFRDAILAECPYCFSCGAAAELVDHIVPKRQGGSDHPNNLQPLCRSCHASKTFGEVGGFGR